MSDPIATIPPPWRYRLLLRLAAPVLLAHLLIRSLRDGGWRYLGERLGMAPDGARGRRWIHAASVGEVLTVLPLLEALVEAEPGRRVLVTTTTPTGAAVLARRAPVLVDHVYLPIDWPGACRRFLGRTRPRTAWIVETEIWPWLFAECRHCRHVPTIINARLSARTLEGPARWLRHTFAQALTGVHVLARSDEDARRYVTLGASAESVGTLGNLKFADNGDADAHEPLITGHYCVAASTHDDEERQLAEHWLQQPDGLLVIVPRHPERGARLSTQLNALCAAAGSPRCARRAFDELPAAGARLYLADTLGELQAWFSAAETVFVGGSLVPVGGHNVFEPARQGRAIVIGPHVANFTDAVELLQQTDAIEQVVDAESAVARLRYLAADRQRACDLGTRAQRAVTAHADIARRYLDRLLCS